MTASAKRRIARGEVMSLISLCAALLCNGCTDVGQDSVSFPLLAGGSLIEDDFAGQAGWTLSMSRAELAFGPLVLCTGAQAGHLCEVAQAEWLGSTVVDVLDPQTRRVGQMKGSTGMALSWMYDLGIASMHTQQDPMLLPAAEALGGYSVRLSGTASREDGALLSFEAALRVQQEEDTEVGVPVVRKSTSDAFSHDITEDGASLTVVFDVRPWLTGIDFDSIVASEACSTDGCAGGVTLEPDSQGGRAVHNGLVAGERPTFVWTAPEP